MLDAVAEVEARFQRLVQDVRPSEYVGASDLWRVIEDRMLVRLEAETIRYLSSAEQGLDIRAPDNAGIFTIGSDFFQVHIRERGSTVELLISQLGVRRAVRCRGAVHGLGRYKAVLIAVGEALAGHAEPLAVLLSSGLSAGYRGAFTRVQAEVSKAHGSTDGQLLVLLREWIPPSAARSVYLYRHDRDTTTQLVDDTSLSLSCETSRKLRLPSPVSPVELQLTISDRQFAFSGTASHGAVQASRSIEGSLDDRTLAYSGSLAEIAERQLLHGSNYVVTPLASRGEHHLTAVYPPDVRGDVEPRLLQGTDEFAELLGRKGTTRKRSRSTGGAGDLAELLGRFAGGFTQAAGQ